MSDSTKEALEERWQLLWARGRELDEREERLLASLPEIEEAVYLRAEAQLRAERDQHQADLLDLRRQMEEYGGFGE